MPTLVGSNSVQPPVYGMSPASSLTYSSQSFVTCGTQCSLVPLASHLILVGFETSSYSPGPSLSCGLSRPRLCSPRGSGQALCALRGPRASFLTHHSIRMAPSQRIRFPVRSFRKSHSGGSMLNLLFLGIIGDNLEVNIGNPLWQEVHGK